MAPRRVTTRAEPPAGPKKSELGRYRLTTKLPEYLSSGLPVAMSPIPGYYDYAMQAGWRLPALHPADPAFHQATAAWLDTITWETIDERRKTAPYVAYKHFDYQVVRPRFESFINDLSNETHTFRPVTARLSSQSRID